MYSLVNPHSPPRGVYEPLTVDWTPPTSATTPRFPSFTSPFSPNRRQFDSHSSEYWTPSSPSHVVKEKRKTLVLPSGLPTPKTSARPIFKGFERPDWRQLAVHVFGCFISYPVMYLVTLAAKDRSLFLTRVLVATWASVVGFCLAFSLVVFATKYLEAASELLFLITFDLR